MEAGDRVIEDCRNLSSLEGARFRAAALCWNARIGGDYQE